MAATEGTTTTVTQDEDIQADINSFAQTIIAEYQSRHQVTVLNHSLEAERTAEVGRYFCSNLFRLNLAFELNGEKCRSSVVLKVPQLSPAYPKLKKYGLYETETYMYETMLSRIHQFWPGETLSPLFYGVSPSGILALENMQEHGFRLLPKNALMNLIECKLVLKRLAQFHGASVKYFKLYESEEKAKLTVDAAGNDFPLGPLIGKITTFVSSTLSPSQLEKWTHFQQNSLPVLIDVYSANAAAAFTVQLHGDLQTNNLLVKDGGQCKFIDFQLCRRGSPVIDLIYFVVTSVKWEVVERHLDELFKYYSDALKEVLAELDCTNESYTLEQLNGEFDEYKVYLIFVLCFVVPLLRSGIPSMEGWSEKEETMLDSVIRSKEYNSFFKNWLELI